MGVVVGITILTSTINVRVKKLLEMVAFANEDSKIELLINGSSFTT